MQRYGSELAGICLGAAWLAGGCVESEAPRIVDFRYDGQAPDSPSVLLFSLDFEDLDRDLGGGVMETFVDGRASGLGQVALGPIFRWSETPLDASEGSLEFVLELAIENVPETNRSFTVGVRLIDSLTHVSQPSEIRLSIEDAEIPFFSNE